MEHLVEHMRVSYHSVHEPKCDVCKKHCRSFESLREHLSRKDGVSGLLAGRSNKIDGSLQLNHHSIARLV
jgi:hypothetical protein